jgi:hypothetical protein
LLVIRKYLWRDIKKKKKYIWGKGKEEREKKQYKYIYICEWQKKKKNLINFCVSLVFIFCYKNDPSKIDFFGNPALLSCARWYLLFTPVFFLGGLYFIL